MNVDDFLKIINVFSENLNSRALLCLTICFLPTGGMFAYASIPISKNCGMTPGKLSSLLFDKSVMYSGEAKIIDTHYYRRREIRPEHRDIPISSVSSSELRQLYNRVWQEEARELKYCAQGLLDTYENRTSFMIKQLYPYQLEERMERIGAVIRYIEKREKLWGIEL